LHIQELKDECSCNPIETRFKLLQDSSRNTFDYEKRKFRSVQISSDGETKNDEWNQFFLIPIGCLLFLILPFDQWTHFQPGIKFGQSEP
jgi:hypothetical protein